MLPLSNVTITLNKSKDYLKCTCLLHLLTLIVLMRSGLPLALKSFFGILVIVFFIKIFRAKLPLPNYQQLTYHRGYWLLHETVGQQIKYERAEIGFEGGIFILLKLTGISPRKTLVIFKDQITVEQYRILKFINLCDS